MKLVAVALLSDGLCVTELITVSASAGRRVAAAQLCLFWFLRRENLLSSGSFPSANGPSPTNYGEKKRPEDKEELLVFSCLLCVKLTNSRNCGCGLTAACKTCRAEHVMLQSFRSSPSFMSLVM